MASGPPDQFGYLHGAPQSAAPASEWGRYVEDPAWLPSSYDARNDTLTFAYAPRQAQRRIVFLDPRFLGRAAKSSPAPVADLPEDALAAAAGPLGFIFHTGFCCSTLLARALDVPGVCMGLKEPSVLVSFARFWTTGRRAPGALAALGATLDLLSRPFAPGEMQIVKPSNVVNHILPQIMHARPDARVLVLCSSLDGYLHAIARRGLDGRAFAREMFKHFEHVIPLDGGLASEDMLLLTDLQIAALAWLMQAQFMRSIATRFGPARVRVLNCDTLLDDKAGALTRLAAFFGMNADPKLWTRVAQGPVFAEHAKEFGRAFDAAAMRTQHKTAGATHGEELARARDWARALALHCNAPLTLDETL